MNITPLISAPLHPAPGPSAPSGIEAATGAPVDAVRLQTTASEAQAVSATACANPTRATSTPTPLQFPTGDSQAALACGLVACAPAAAAVEAVKALAESRPRPAGDAAREAAEHLVAGFEADTAALYPTSGFDNRDALLAAVSASTETAQRAARILVDESLQICMAAPPSTRDGVAQKGFLNFRGSNVSQGAILDRETVEANYAGMDVEKYTALDADLKPKYGYVAPESDSGLESPVGVRSYGSDHWVFKLDRVRNRLTFTVGDSLNRHMNYTCGYDTPATSWDQRFTPWSSRELAAPAIAGGLDHQKKLGLEMDVWRESLETMQNEWPSLKQVIQLTESPDPKEPVDWTALEIGITPPPGTLEKYTVAWGPSLDYIEAQIWGPLDLDDVKAFEFTDKPPEGAFLEALQSHGIEIRDGRAKPAHA